MEHEMRRYIGETDGDREEGGRIEIQNTSLGLQKKWGVELSCFITTPPSAKTALCLAGRMVGIINKMQAHKPEPKREKGAYSSN